MVPLWMFPLAAVLTAVGAGLVARWRGLVAGRIRVEALAALGAGAAGVGTGVVCYVLEGRVGDGIALRNAGALCFLLTPVVAVAALHVAARRLGVRRGSTVGAAALGMVATGLLAGRVATSWRGPRGDWPVAEALLLAASVAALYGALACFGWWCGRGIGKGHA